MGHSRLKRRALRQAHFRFAPKADVRFLRSFVLTEFWSRCAKNRHQTDVVQIIGGSAENLGAFILRPVGRARQSKAGRTLRSRERQANVNCKHSCRNSAAGPGVSTFECFSQYTIRIGICPRMGLTTDQQLIRRAPYPRFPAFPH